MHVYESNNIRVSGYPLPLKLKIVDDLTIDNPAYLKAKYQRRPTWGIDQKLQLFTYDNDGSLILYTVLFQKQRRPLNGIRNR